MALPYSPRTTFDVTVNLGSTSTRAFEGATYAGKHVRVIPKTIVDTDKGLLFNGAASVTIIGGSFKPATRTTWAAGNVADGHMVFFNCGAVYLEGVLIDGINVTELDGVQVSAITAATQVTIQNCRFQNIKGIESGLHGDLFQTGSDNMGPTGAVRIHRFSGTCNYQGFFLDPQVSGARSGGIASVTMSDVNVVRNGTTTSRLYYWYATQTRYTSFGYPISLTNVWANPGSGQTVEGDAVWPANYAGSNNNFPTASYRAVRGTDTTGAYANWPGLNATGKVLSGRVYEGTPPGGDFVKADDIGLGYVQGTDLSSPVVVTPPPVTNLPPGANNLIIPANWISGGTGTATRNATTGALTVTPANDTTRTYHRQQVIVQVGRTYQITWELQTTNQMWRMLGKTEGADDIVAVNVSTVTENKLTFTATTSSVWLEFNRVSAGATTVGMVRFEEVPPNASKSRRLNGRNQYLKLDAGTAGLLTANASQYVGGWVKFQYLPAAGVYIADFATADATTSGGQSRARIVYDPSVPKILASTGGATVYYENFINITAPLPDTWHYVGMAIAANRTIRVVYDTTIGGTQASTGTPEAANFFQTLQLGARVGTTVSAYAPVLLSDWVWCAGFVPTDAQILALASANRPNDISGFTPTYYWPLEGTLITEDSVNSAATLTASNVPGNNVGPDFIVPTPTEILPLLMF